MWWLLLSLAQAECPDPAFGGTLPAKEALDVPTNASVRWEILSGEPVAGTHRLIRVEDEAVVASSDGSALTATLDPFTVFRLELLLDDVVADQVRFVTGEGPDKKPPDPPSLRSIQWLTIENSYSADRGGTELTLEFYRPSEVVAWRVEWAADSGFTVDPSGPHDYFDEVTARLGGTYLCELRPGGDVDPTTDWIRVWAVDQAGNVSDPTVIAPHAVEHDVRDESEHWEDDDPEESVSRDSGTPDDGKPNDEGGGCATTGGTAEGSAVGLWLLVFVLQGRPPRGRPPVDSGLRARR